MDFDEIAEEQGWDTDSMLGVVRGFVSEYGNEAGLSEYAERVASEENGEV